MRKPSCLFVAAIVLNVAGADKPNTPGYVLGPGDQVIVQVAELPDYGTRPYRIDADGSLSLPLMGRVRAEGLTLPQFEAEVVAGLKKQVIDPHLVVTVTEQRPEPISIMGSVNNPGTQLLQGRKTLFDVVAAAGGLKPDAGNRIAITRQEDEGALTLPDVVKDPATGRMTGSIKVADLVDLRDSASNITVRPHDEISVPRAQLIYVIGNVKRAGGFTLREGSTFSALEALSMAEGLAPNASPKSAHILRKTGTDSTSRQRIPINLQKILSGKSPDVELTAADILFIPDNVSKRVTTRTLETALNTISGVAIFRGF